MIDKCYRCETELTIDPIGYSPSCAYYPKCREIREDNFDNKKVKIKKLLIRIKDLEGREGWISTDELVKEVILLVGEAISNIIPPSKDGGFCP